MTEDEAKTKWCPMSRVHGMESAGNRTDNAQCIASDCACWVWDNGLIDTRGKVKGEGDRVLKGNGHCGLIK